jgi:AraC-like DNA-binding protein
VVLAANSNAVLSVPHATALSLTRRPTWTAYAPYLQNASVKGCVGEVQMTAEQGASFALRIATGDLPAASRLPALRDLFDRSIGMDITAEDGQPVDLQVNAVPGLRRATMRRPFTARAARTSPRLSDGDDTVCLMIKSAGQMALYQGRYETVPDVGDGMLLVYRHPSQLVFQQATYLSLRVPLQALAMLVDVEAAAGQRIIGETQALVLLRHYVASMPQQLADPTLAGLIATHVHDLMALAIGATGEGREIARGRGVRAARLQTIKADLTRDVSQSIDEIARRQAVTPRYVQTLFEEQGTTFGEFVTARRLDVARSMLRSPRYAGWSIAGIAFESGFRDLSHFNRRFRRQFGVTPSEFRRHGGSGANPGIVIQSD